MATEAARNASLSPTVSPTARLAALTALGDCSAGAPPAEYLGALIGSAHLLTTSAAVARAEALLRAADAPGAALRCARLPPPGRHAARATVRLASCVYGAAPEATVVLLRALAGGAAARDVAIAAERVGAAGVPGVLDAAEAAVKGLSGGGKAKGKDAKDVRAKEGIAAAALELAGEVPEFPSAELRRLLDVVTTAALAGVDVRPCRVMREAQTADVVPALCAAVERALRRDKARALRAIPQLLGLFRGADFSDAVGTIGDAACDATQSSDEDVRAMGVRVAAALAQRCKEPGRGDSDGLGGCVKKLGACLKSAKYAYQRTSAAAAIVEICDAASCDDVTLNGITVVSTWIRAKKETGDEARAAAVCALLDLLALLRGDGETDDAAADGRALVAELLTVPSKRSGAEFERRAIVSRLGRLDFDTDRCVGYGRSAASDIVSALCALAMTKPTQAVADDALRAAALLLEFGGSAQRSAVANSSWDLFASFTRDVKQSPVLRSAATAARVHTGHAVESAEDACALAMSAGCMLRSHFSQPELELGPGELSNLATAVTRLAADARPSIARIGRKWVRLVRKTGGDVAAELLLRVLWESELAESPAAVAASRLCYDFEDFGLERERLSTAILSCVMPCVPSIVAPLALLAAHHPRVYRAVDEKLPAVPLPRSRCWPVIQASLPAFSPMDDGDGDFEDEELEDEHDGAGSTVRKPGKVWLVPALELATGECGLLSGKPQLVKCATFALAGLVRCSDSNEIATQLMRRILPMLQGLAGSAPSLSVDHWAAAEKVRAADAKAALDAATAAGALASSKSSSKAKKVPVKPKAPPPGSAAAAAAEKLAIAQTLAAEVEVAVARSTASLNTLKYLCYAVPKASQTTCPTILSLIMPSASFPPLESSCRAALLALAETFDKPLRSMAVDISSTLYRLYAFGEGDSSDDVFADVARLIQWLKKVCNPALSAEGFALIAPIVKESMMRSPGVAETGGRTSAARAAAASRKKEAVGITRAGAEVLRVHCMPEAIDAAVAAAAARAGSWALAVLEREDAAFGIAGDALASLTGTALNPGSHLLSQILGGVISGKSSVRESALAALERLPALSMSAVACPRDPVLGRTLWLGMHDPEEENAGIARDLWDQYKHPLHVADDAVAMLALLAHVEPEVRVMAARAIAESLTGDENSSTRNVVIPQAFTLYLKKLPISVGGLAPATGKGADKSIPKQRRAGRDGDEEESTDEGWYARHGVALALRDMADCGTLTDKDIPVVFAFMASRGLGDLHDNVRTQMSAAAMAVVERAGAELGPSMLLPMIEKQLNASTNTSGGASKEAVAHADRTRENLVMCLGGVAGHLPSEDPRKMKTADQVIRTAMETPSESVQNAAARCLVPLAPAAIQGGRSRELRDRLVNKLWDPDASYGERRGAAYALAGLVCGLGIPTMKEYGLVDELEKAAADKHDARRRQGAFMCMETLAIMLGRLYEPYTVRALPILLVSMGDSVVEVRNACWAAAQASMAEVSSQGVKMILPSLLSGLNERQWRTKAGSAEVLGAMAFCAPRQLSLCLPQVVPKLAGALADAHPKVVAAAESAIGRIAAVARSPEVRNLSRFLLAALRDPSERTAGALDAMLGTEFVHAIDPASLALLIPPLHRGLRDRSTALKKRAAAIVGSMCNNVSNVQDVAPYLDLLLPDLRGTLIDAIPDVRRTSARALGALAVALGEGGLPGIVPWLVASLVAGGSGAVVSTSLPSSFGAVTVLSSAERSGVAMGLAEVCTALLDDRIEDILNRVLKAGSSSAEAREGGLMLLASMPFALGERYEDRLAMALASILRGLSDDSDNVREAALDAGRKTVTTYAKTSLETLLPELLSAMRDKLWRIRHAATQLLGDFLLVLAGAIKPGGKSDADAAGNDAELINSDDEAGNDEGEEGGSDDGEDSDEEGIDSPEMMLAAMTLEATMKAIEEVLGIDRRNEVLAALYIIRCDVSIRVRQMGMQVWKTVVSNTPRVLREIMPSAVRQVVIALSDEDEERRAAAGKALGDLSQKLGDRVVPEVLPALQAGILDKTLSERVRLGACDGLSELVSSCPKDQLVIHGDKLLGAVSDGLCDTSAAVRASAAAVFATLLRPLGSTAVDAIIPMLVEKLSGGARENGVDDSEDDTEADRALDAMKQLMSASGTRLLSIVVPQLLEERPLTVATCRALAAAAIAAEGEFELYVADVVDVLLEAVDSASADALPVEEMEDAIGELIAAMASGGDETSVEMLEKIYLAFNEFSVSRRLAAGTLCAAFCRSTDSDIVSARAVSLFEVLIRQLSDKDEAVVKSASDGLLQLTSTVPASDLTPHVGHIRQALRSTAAGVRVGDPTALIAGLNIPKGSAPFVPIFIEALLHGSPSAREQAALSIADLTEMTNAKILTPFVIKLTGSLIRVASERFPWQVKAAILRAMLRLLEKAAPLLRTFAPQLQSTFVKSLADTNRLVRVRGCAALGALVPVQPRVEALLNELLALGENGPHEGARAAAYLGTARVFKNAKKLPAAAFESMPLTLLAGLQDDDQDVGKAAARALGVLASRSEGPEEYTALLAVVLNRIDSAESDYDERARALVAVGYMSRAGVPVTSKNAFDWSHVEGCVDVVKRSLSSSAPPVQSAGASAAVDLHVLLETSSLKASSAESRCELLAQIGMMAEMDDSAEVRVNVMQAVKKLVAKRPEVVASLAPALVVCAGTNNTAIRNAADRVLRRAFVVAGQGIVDKKNVEAAKSALDRDDQQFVDRRLLKLVEMPDSDVEDDLATADD